MTSQFSVMDRTVGGDAPCFIVAEIGANHDGDLSKALELVHMAVEAGVDAIKLQSYTSEDLVTDPGRIVKWGPAHNQVREAIGAMFDRLSLPLDQQQQVLEEAQTLGVIGFSTPFSLEAVDALEALDVPLFKVASSDISYKDLLDKLARQPRPVLLSTGKASLQEIVRAVDLFRDKSARLGLLHCVAQYPAPIGDLQLKSIPAFATLFSNAVVGFSDHSQGITGALGAVALGAKILEKHITFDQDSNGPDHWFSADEQELRSLCTEVRRLEAALGGPRVRVLDCEIEEKRVSTRSLIVAADLSAGTEIKEAHLVIKRPGTGIDPFHREAVLGLPLSRAVKAGQPLTWDCFKSRK